MGNGRKKLFRNPRHRVFGGVCSGLSSYLSINRMVIRIFFLVFSFFFLVTIPLYLFLWFTVTKARTEKDYASMKSSFNFIEPDGSSFTNINRERENSISKNEYARGIVYTSFIWIGLLMIMCIIGSLSSLFFIDFISISSFSNSVKPLYLLNSKWSQSAPFSFDAWTYLFSLLFPFYFLLILGLKKTQKINVNTFLLRFIGLVWVCSIFIQFIY